MNKPRIHKIVLTGGPCAGKTTALAKITERLESLGYHVLRVPEAATLLMMGGATPGKMPPFQFQMDVVHLQRDLEDRFWGAAAEMCVQSERGAVVLCDRGTMDSAAYMTKDAWAALLDHCRWSVVELRDERYEAVIHMRTAALGAEAFYTTANNAARTETVEQARELDEKTLDAWVGHPHVSVVWNPGSFEEKIRMTLRAVCRVVGIPEPLEIERKYAVRKVGEIPAGAQTVKIEQIYLGLGGQHPGERIRRRTQHGTSVYFHTTKKRIDDVTRIETERQITPREYLLFREKADPLREPIHKTRTCFIWKEQYFELDRFQGKLDGLVFLEAELGDASDKVPLPPFIDIVGEVTEKKAYSNSELARFDSAFKKARLRIGGKPVIGCGGPWHYESHGFHSSCPACPNNARGADDWTNEIPWEPAR